MNILLYSLKLRVELLTEAYQKAYQKIQENAKNYLDGEVVASEISEIPEYA